MRIKKFNNLFDSIIVLLGELYFISGYSIMLVYGVIKNEAGNKILTCIVGSVIFIPVIIIIFIGLLKGCFEWWEINNEYVESKKVFHKKIQIRLEEIISITEEVVPAIIFETYRTNAAIIKSRTKKIVIYLNEKITIDYIKKLLNNLN